MTRCEVLVVGGGPAGSTCAWKLHEAGVDVMLLDRAVFPRDKPCAGWITPQVLALLELSLDEYRASGRTAQTISAFRTGPIDGASVDVAFGRPVSYGICRSEFDEYLLKRSRARVIQGTAVESIRRRNGRWVVNDAFEARLLIGAGGHFCPVARHLSGAPAHERVVVAREVEVRMEPGEAARCVVAGDMPELRFCRDLRGYGWLFRKGNVLNVGLGREDVHHLAQHVEAFVATLDASVRGIVDRGRWRGHAYLLRDASRRAAVSDGALLIGDAAGLAYTFSGEGIEPAVESACLAADAIVAAAGDAGDALTRYASMLHERFSRRPDRRWSHWLPERAAAAAARWLCTNAWFVRRVVLEGRFLHCERESESKVA